MVSSYRSTPLPVQLSRESRLIILAPYVLCLIALVLRAFRLDFQPIWFDEDLAFQRATATLDVSLASMAGSPLYYIVLRGWVELAGSSLFALRFFSAVCGMLAIPLLYQLTRRLLGQRMALATMAVTTLAPFYVYYSQEARTYSFTLVLMLVSMLAFLRWLDTRRTQSLTVCTLANLICLYTHYVAALVIVTQGMILLLMHWRDWRRIAVFVMAQTIAVLALVPWLVRVETVLPRVVAPPDSTTLDAWSILARTWTEFSIGRTIPPPLSLYLAMIPLFLVLAGLSSLFDRRQSNRPRQSSSAPSRREMDRSIGRMSNDRSSREFARTVLLVWLIIPLVGTLLVPRASVRFSPKYLIAITPVYYMLIVLGLRALRKESRVLLGIGLVLLISIWLYALGDYYLRQHDKLAQVSQTQVVMRMERRPDEVIRKADLQI